MKLTNPMTYGEAADIINICDEQNIMLYFKASNDFKIPVDNYEFFKIVTGEDPDETFPMFLIEDLDDNIELSVID